MRRLGFGFGSSRSLHGNLVEIGSGGNTGGGNTGGGGGGLGSVVAPAIHVSGGVSLEAAALNVTDSPLVAVSYWVRYPTTADRGHFYSFASDAQNDEMDWNASFNGGPDDGRMGVAFGESTNFNFERAVGAVATLNQWHHILIVFKGEPGNGNANQLVIYQDRQLVNFAGTHTSHASTSFTPTLNGKTMNVASDGYNTAVEVDIADFWFSVGHDLLEADGTVSSATLDKFVTADLTPVGLGASGQFPTGSTPAIFLHSDGSDPATFAINRGTGGSFAITNGTLANSSGNPG